MYSVKPGRGPSLMGGVAGIVVAIFGVGWTVVASSLGFPPFFALFGVLFVVMAIVGAIYNFYNATSRDRMSTLDITTPGEESDPIANALGYGTQRREEHPRDADANAKPRKYEGNFCPFCGAAVEPTFDYCPKCGKDI